jgi:class 3 adenylate cyclase
VHAAARVMAQSSADEVLVSRVVTDLVAGASLNSLIADRTSLRAFRADGIFLLRAYRGYICLWSLSDLARYRSAAGIGG